MRQPRPPIHEITVSELFRLSDNTNPQEINNLFSDDAILESGDTFKTITNDDRRTSVLSRLFTILRNIPKITTVNLLSCKITTLPDNIGDLTTLKVLNLNNNRLSSLPDTISNLTNLQKLNLSDNYFTSLPATIVNFSNLERLDFQDMKTNLTTLPQSFLNLPANLFFLIDTDNLDPDSNSILALYYLEREARALRQSERERQQERERRQERERQERERERERPERRERQARATPQSQETNEERRRRLAEINRRREENEIGLNPTNPTTNNPSVINTTIRNNNNPVSYPPNSNNLNPRGGGRKTKKYRSRKVIKKRGSKKGRC